MKLLDCTLRDGGYYTNWDFDKSVVDAYIECVDKLPIDYIEIGYRSVMQNEYFGEYYYLPLSTVMGIKERTSTALSIMVNATGCEVVDLEGLLTDLVGLVKLVRIAVAVEHLDHGKNLAFEIKKLGFEVGINIMRAPDLLKGDIGKHLDEVEQCVDYLYLVDSYGSIHPNELVKLFELVQSVSPAHLGFHGHNNIELAFANSISAMECNCSIIDFTVLGMGRGAGNLKTELFLTYLKKQKGLDVDLNTVGTLVESFSALLAMHNWGTNLAYMASGAYALPQKNVMDALALNRYSLSTIVNNMKFDQNDQINYLQMNSTYNECLIIGGGNSVNDHQVAIERFLTMNKDLLVIHATSKYIDHFNGIDNEQVCVISGDELLKFTKMPSCVKTFILGENSLFVDQHDKDVKFYKLGGLSSTKYNYDSPLAMAFQLSKDTKVNNINLVGFDGYEELKNKKELYLMNENQRIINDFNKISNITSLTATKYDNVKRRSIYHAIIKL